MIINLYYKAAFLHFFLHAPLYFWKPKFFLTVLSGSEMFHKLKDISEIENLHYK